MVKKVLIIVESPLQLINANEYLNVYPYNSEVVFYILSSRDKNNLIQLRETFKGLNLSGEIRDISVIEIDKNPLRRLKFYLKVINVAKKSRNKDFDLVLIGHIASIYQAILANSIKMTEFVYLDDGTAAFHENEVLRNRMIKSFSPMYKRIFPLILGLKAEIKFVNGQIRFFTMYKELITNNFPHLKYTLNEFKYLKKEYNKKPVNNNLIYFIGTPFYWHYPDFKKTKIILDEVIEYYKDRDVLYFPHRYENSKNLEYLEKSGWKIFKTKVPIELSLIGQPCLPMEFGMFTTSAFYTINMLVPNLKFRSFEFPNLLEIFNGENTYKLYREYEQNENITLVKILNEWDNEVEAK